MKQSVKSIGVLSAGKISGLIYASLGLLFAPFFLVISLVGSITGDQKAAPFAGIFGILMAVFLPVMYGFLGFITGLIGALLYNLFARWEGGIELELEPVPVMVAPYPIIPPVAPVS